MLSGQSAGAVNLGPYLVKWFGLPRGGHGGVDVLRTAEPGERHREGRAVRHGSKRSDRRTDLQSADGRDVRVAVAEVVIQVSAEKARTWAPTFRGCRTR